MDEVIAKIRADLAPRRLGTWPTPLEPAPALARACEIEALWVKREDRSSPRYGGSKVRGLEFLLAGAPDDAVAVTIGGTGSTHCLATAVHAGALSLRSVLAQFPQFETDAARALADAAARAATVTLRARWRASFPLTVLQAWRAAHTLGRPWWIPGGGAHPRAVVGQLLGGLELGAQLAQPPDAVVVAMGSTGTVAGLLLAMQWLEWPTVVVGVRVAPRIVASGWRAHLLARAATRRLAAIGVRAPVRGPPARLMVVHGLGRGYGYPTPAGERAMALGAAHGLVLDPTYTAKAFGVIPTLAERGLRRILFWHTFAPPAQELPA